MLNKIIEAMEKLERNGIDPSKVLVGLTGIERSILNVLIENEQAMNPNEIRRALILDVMRFFLSVSGKVKEEYTLKYWRGGLHYPAEEKELFKLWHKNRNLPPQKRFEEDAKLLKRFGVADIPDYRTIERILREMELMGIVISRDEVGKAKKVYFVNPVFLEKVKKGF